MARPHQGIVAKVAADVGRNDFTVDAIAWDEILVLSGGGRGPRHCCDGVDGDGLVMEGWKGERGECGEGEKRGGRQ